LRGFFVSVNAAFGLSLIFPCLYLISNSKTDQRGTKGGTPFALSGEWIREL